MLMNNCQILQTINNWVSLDSTSKSSLTLIQTVALEKYTKKMLWEWLFLIEERKRYKHSHEQTEITTSKCVDRD